MPKPSIRTFVSYSHADRDIVEPIITLLRVTRNDVFWDYQSIPLGRKWRKEIESALNQADVIAVFWCQHAEQSSEVDREWRAGLAKGKRLLPIILDQTKMPRSLGQYQAVDFRAVVRSSHDSESKGEGTKLSATTGLIFLAGTLAGC